MWCYWSRGVFSASLNQMKFMDALSSNELQWLDSKIRHHDSNLMSWLPRLWTSYWVFPFRCLVSRNALHMSYWQWKILIFRTGAYYRWCLEGGWMIELDLVKTPTILSDNRGRLPIKFTRAQQFSQYGWINWPYNFEYCHRFYRTLHIP